MKIQHFTDLKVWQDAHDFTLEIYKTSNFFPKEEKYGITDQLRRASASIGANIAEGFGRYHYKEKIHFFYQARGSLLEVENFLYLAKDLSYLKEKDSEMLLSSIKSLLYQLNSLIKSFKTS